MSIFPDPSIFSYNTQTSLASFLKWSGDATKVLSETEIGDFDFTGDGPFVVKAYHGTTHEFSEFKTSVLGNLEGQFGQVHYFTSSHRDALRNYGSDTGADLRCRIENETDRLVCDIEHDPENFDLPEEASFKDCQERAEEIIRARLVGETPRIINAYLRFDKPFVIGSADSRKYRVFPKLWDAYANATQDVLSDHGYDEEPQGDAFYALEDEILEAQDRATDAFHDEMNLALMNAARDLGVEPIELSYDFLDNLDCSHQELEQALRDHPKIMDLECPETGTFINSEYIARVIFHLGYDAIILKDADKRFTTMCMESKTTHIHIFDTSRNRIKSAENCGNFDPDSPNIFS